MTIEVGISQWIISVSYLTGKMSVLSSHLLAQGFWGFRLLKLFVVCKLHYWLLQVFTFCDSVPCKLNKNTPH